MKTSTFRKNQTVGQIQSGPNSSGPRRATEEEGDDDRRHRHDVHELGDVEEREPDRRVLGVVATDDLLLGLDEVERRPVELGRRCDEEDHERHDARARRGSSSTNRSWTMTMPCVESVWLTSTTVATARPSAASYDTICADARTEPISGYFEPGRPTGEHHAVHRDRRHREHQEDADRRIGDLQVGVVPEDVDDPVVAVLEDTAERHDAERDERGDHREQRREAEHEQVGALGQQVLLEEELDAVGQRLQHAPRPGDVRPDAVLHVRDELALEPDHQHHADEQHARTRRRP